MKVYFRASDYHPNHREIIRDFLNGRYPLAGETLWVRNEVPDTTHIWDQLEFHDEYDDVVYELDLPHSMEELAPYRLANEDPSTGPTGWELPWYVVANHPVKVMEYILSRCIMGKPETTEQYAAPDPRH